MHVNQGSYNNNMIGTENKILGVFEMLCWLRMKRISRNSDRVHTNEERKKYLLGIVKENGRYLQIKMLLKNVGKWLDMSPEIYRT